MVNLVAAPALTVNTLLRALVNPLALAVSCLLVPAESISKLVNVATPLPAANPRSRLVEPSSGPVPAESAKVTILLAGRPLVELLPNWSRLLTIGWTPKTLPAVAEAGCVVKASQLAMPATSVNVPRLVLLAVTAAMVAVPLLVRLPLARGVPARGRTRTLVHINEQVTPALLALVTVKVIWLVAREVIATAVPLAT